MRRRRSGRRVAGRQRRRYVAATGNTWEDEEIGIVTNEPIKGPHCPSLHQQLPHINMFYRSRDPNRLRQLALPLFLQRLLFAAVCSWERFPMSLCYLYSNSLYLSALKIQIVERARRGTCISLFTVKRADIVATMKNSLNECLKESDHQL